MIGKVARRLIEHIFQRFLNRSLEITVEKVTYYI